MTCSKAGALRATLLAAAFLLPTSAFAEDTGAKLLSGVFAPGSVAAGEVVPMSEAQLSAMRGAGLLEDLIGLLDEGNTVSVTVDDNPTDSSSGDGPQSIVIDNGNIHIFTGASTGSIPGGTTGTTSVSSSISTRSTTTTSTSSHHVGF